jgi:hypothetical protein
LVLIREKKASAFFFCWHENEGFVLPTEDNGVGGFDKEKLISL